MHGTISERLRELGLELPDVTAPAHSYVPTKEAAGVLHVSGQIPRVNGRVDRFVGKVGGTISVEEAREAARACALNLLAQVSAAVGGELGRVKGVLRMRGYVNATPDFDAHPAVMNAASDLMIAVFGERGRHTRTAIGVGSLPQGVAVELDAEFHL